jgi:bifunctional DNA-binding transcriptional regulator/antitoxin component of YhaV-PrlF toxin-antitoxin module
MGRNRDETIRKLTKLGKESYGITLPISIIRKFNWKERQKLQLEIDEAKHKIVIRDWVP